MAARTAPRNGRYRMIAVVVSATAITLAGIAVAIALSWQGSRVVAVPDSASPSPVRGVVGTPRPSASGSSDTAVGVPSAENSNGSAALRKYVRLTSCRPATDGWEASGTATWHGSGASSLTATVAFTDDSSRALAIATTDIVVTAGAKVPWTTTAHFSAPDATHCVLVGVKPTS